MRNGQGLYLCPMAVVERSCMPAAPHPLDEARRLAAPRRLGILDSARDAALDAITTAASVVCGTPISLISLVDENRQWFKSNIGLPGARNRRHVLEIGACYPTLSIADRGPKIPADGKADGAQVLVVGWRAGRSGGVGEKVTGHGDDTVTQAVRRRIGADGV